MIKPFQNEVNTQRKEFAPIGANSFLRVDLVKMEGQKKNKKKKKKKTKMPELLPTKV